MIQGIYSYKTVHNILQYITKHICMQKNKQMPTTQVTQLQKVMQLQKSFLQKSTLQKSR